MNKVFLIGNLTRDPELSTTNSGASVCKFGLAVQRRFTNKQTGEREVDFFDVTVWSAQGENCHKYLRKGNKACVTGRVEIRTYDKDGVKMKAVDIIADEVEFLTSPSESGGSGNGSGGANAPLLFEGFDEFSHLKDGQSAELVDDGIDISHGSVWCRRTGRLSGISESATRSPTRDLFVCWCFGCFSRRRHPKKCRPREKILVKVEPRPSP